MKTRTAGGDRNERRGMPKSNKNQNAGRRGDGIQTQNSDKEQYYKFYLDSAQKAIEMMRKQHKSASLMRMA